METIEAMLHAQVLFKEQVRGELVRRELLWPYIIPMIFMQTSICDIQKEKAVWS